MKKTACSFAWDPSYLGDRAFTGSGGPSWILMGFSCCPDVSVLWRDFVSPFCASCLLVNRVNSRVKIVDPHLFVPLNTSPERNDQPNMQVKGVASLSGIVRMSRHGSCRANVPVAQPNWLASGLASFWQSGDCDFISSAPAAGMQGRRSPPRSWPLRRGGAPLARRKGQRGSFSYL
jgi:hypothetical protein